MKQPLKIDAPERPRTPEELIWIHVLSDGIACALKKPCETSRWKNYANQLSFDRENSNIKRDAIIWIRSNREGIGTFKYCCEILDIDYKELRVKVEMLMGETNGKIRFSGKKIPKVAAIAAGLGVQIYGRPRKDNKVGEAISGV